MPAKEAQYMKIVTTAIPANTGSGKSIAELLTASTNMDLPGVATNEYLTTDELARVVDWVILGELPVDGVTDRGAINVASLAAMTRFYQVASGAEWGPSVYGNLACGAGKITVSKGPFVRSNTTSAIAAGILVWIK